MHSRALTQGQIISNHLRKNEVDEHATKIREQYDFLETFLSKSKFIATDYVTFKWPFVGWFIAISIFFSFVPQLTIADLSVVTIVSTIDMIVRVEEDKWPNLYDWWNNRMKKLPYYDTANHDGLLALKSVTQSSTDYEINF